MKSTGSPATAVLMLLMLFMLLMLLGSIAIPASASEPPKPLAPPDDSTMHMAQKALLNLQREFAMAKSAMLEAQIKLQQAEAQYAKLVADMRAKYKAGEEWSISADLKWTKTEPSKPEDGKTEGPKPEAVK